LFVPLATLVCLFVIGCRQPLPQAPGEKVDQGTSRAAHGDPTLERALRTLHTALESFESHSREGGWPQAWTQDRRLSWGQKGVVPNSWVTIQPPATPDAGTIYIEAAKVLGDQRYLQVAQRARDAMLALQTPAGGFVKEGDPLNGPDGPGTFDDDVTTGALRFLIALHRASGSRQDRAALDDVGAFLLKSQYGIGGWPQRYPPDPSHYGAHITFNDDVMANAVAALLELHDLTQDARYLASALRAGDCIIRLQGGAGEEIWAQQYDPRTLEPAPARPFEPAGYSPNESRGVCDALLRLYLTTGLDRFLEPLPRAFAWYDAHRLPNGMWARLYEPGTQRPIYGRTDGVATYDLTEARSTYSWQNLWYPWRAKVLYDRILRMGRDAVRAESRAARSGRLPITSSRVHAICDALSQDGFWLTPPSAEQAEELGELPGLGIISIEVFCDHASRLLDFISERLSGT